jgi:uncharacterized protein YciI
MFVVLLRFAANRAAAPRLMDGHNAWLRKGFDEGSFLLAGGIEPKAGGAILATAVSRADVEARVAEDPFVAESVVAAEIIEVAPGRTDPRLAFLAA